MSDNSKMELDVIKDDNDSPNYKIIAHNSFSSLNKSNEEEEDFYKSVNNIAKMSKMSSLSRNLHNSESEDLYQYQKFKFSSSSTELRTKNGSKKVSENSSIPNNTLVVNTLSPSKKKKLSSFKMVEKSKYKKIFDTQDFNARRVDQETITGRERRDAFGNEIKKKNKRKIKVSFVDQLHEDQPLVNVIDIESFKKYNFIIGMPKEDNIKSTNVNSNCQCCIMF